MKFLRHRRTIRIISVFLLLTFLQPLATPYYAMALTHGPHQPEYTSYEEPGATDMVNLLTGDFTYSLPVLDMPGPSGSFSAPLTYNAGIGPEQQASWVGLGWNMNVGAITRNTNQFPDDAAGESHTVRVMDLTGLRGWQSSALGLGAMGWNSLQGHYGSIGLLSIVNAAWGEGSTSVGIAGFNVTSNGMNFNAVQFGLAVVTVASYGATGAAAQGVSSGVAIARQAALDLAVQASVSAATSASTPSAPLAGNWKYSKKTKQKFLHKEYKIWLDQTRVENMYGTLYSGKAALSNYTHPTGFPVLSFSNSGTRETVKSFQKTTASSGNTALNMGSASDINYAVPDGTAFLDVHNPAFLATDDYSVSGPGISGAITPYRLDVGSVSMPREMSDDHTRLGLVPYADYKVPFLYKGSSNEYFHHVGGASSVTTPTPYFGIAAQESFTGSTREMLFNASDVTFKSERVRNDLSQMLQASNKQNRFSQGNHVEWLSNAEIGSAATYPGSKFLDFLPYSERQVFRGNYTTGQTGAPKDYFTSMVSFGPQIGVTADVASTINPGSLVKVDYAYKSVDQQGQPIEYVKSIVSSVASKTTTSITLNGVNSGTPGYGLPATITLTYYRPPQIQNGIGGYVVTAQDGTSYHYALPIYDYDERSEAINKTDANKRSLITRSAPFANTWLLTAITGSDFVDRNENGVADDADWGYWVKFNYGNHTDSYQWRVPYGENVYRRDPSDATNTYSSGIKQLYYLNTIETASHVALFLKSERLDGRGMSANNTVLKLDEICVLAKEHYKKLTTATQSGGLGISDFSNQVKLMCLSGSFVNDRRAFLNKNTLKRVVFQYDYILCPGTPNSTASEGRKLTLTGVSLRGRNDIKIVPDYKFEYGNNAAYSINGWDGWEMYSATATSSGTTHQATSDGTQWSLNKIITPLGSEISITYERDTYSSVSGYEMLGSRVNFSHGGKEWFDRDIAEFWTGGNGSTITNAINQGVLKVGSLVNLDGSADIRCVDGTSYQHVSYDVERIKISSIDLEHEVIRFDRNPFVRPFCAPTDETYYGHNQGTIEIVGTDKPGGNIRVASISVTDDVGLPNKIRYLYTADDGTSSGVVSQETEYWRNSSIPKAIYDLGYSPRTPVMYGKVTVLTGGLTTDSDYHTRTVYKFETPHHSMIVYRPNNVVSNNGTRYKLVTFNVGSDPNGNNGFALADYAFLKEHVVEDYTSRIGALKSIDVYDRTGTRASSVQLISNHQLKASDGSTNAGIFTQGTLMNDVFSVSNPYGENSMAARFHKMAKTTIVQYDYDVVSKLETQNETFTTTTVNNVWDKYTGQVLDQTVSNSVGISVRNVSVPAYMKYTDMGPKALGGKNMLSGKAAEYQYMSNASGALGGLIRAEVQTWRDDWNNYRKYDGTNYTEGTDGPTIRRKSTVYTYKGSFQKLNPDGTHQFPVADQFNFTNNAANPAWQKVLETVLYDHLSTPLAQRDINGIESVVKIGYNDRMILATALNARYTEVAFSSAEDKLADRPFFGGEVALGNGTLLRRSKGEVASTHTGDAVVSVSSGTAFVYKTTNLRTQIYRANVWANSANGKIYYRINGGAEVVSTVSRKAGDWYLLSINIPVSGTVSSFEVGVKSVSGAVVFDDFRFQPMKSNMTCYVQPVPDIDYASTTDAISTFEYVLDNDNLYTKYQYDERGNLVKIFRESFQYGEKQVSESKMNYKRANQ